MPKGTILVIEDEEDIQELVRYNLSKHGFQVECVGSGEQGLKLVQAQLPDLLLLDLMLPGLDGLEVCRAIKSDQRTRSLPIIMLTARGEESDVVTGLELGADDYITKPFSPRVLVARVRAILRRKNQEPQAPEEIIRIHDFTIDPRRHEVLVGNTRVDLTFTEFRILQLLSSRPGWVFTRYQIVDEIRGNDYAVTDRSVDVHIVGLRRKLGESGDYIQTVRGVGYRMQEPVENT